VASTDPYAPYLADWEGPWNFAGAEETAARLERAGFTEVETWLEPYPVTPPDPIAFVSVVCLGPHLQQLPEELRDPYARAVCEGSGDKLDYVRLNIEAKARA
jgi:trans-aconitate 2-methyltransferase